MVYLLSKFKYPATSADAAGKSFFKVMKEFPNLYKEGTPAKRILGLGRAKNGMETLTIWEVTGDYLKASQELSKLFLVLCDDVKGSTFSITSYLSVMESLPILGLSPPT